VTRDVILFVILFAQKACMHKYYIVLYRPVIRSKHTDHPRSDIVNRRAREEVAE